MQTLFATMYYVTWPSFVQIDARLGQMSSTFMPCPKSGNLSIVMPQQKYHSANGSILIAWILLRHISPS